MLFFNYQYTKNVQVRPTGWNIKYIPHSPKYVYTGLLQCMTKYTFFWPFHNKGHWSKRLKKILCGVSPTVSCKPLENSLSVNNFFVNYSYKVLSLIPRTKDYLN